MNRIDYSEKYVDGCFEYRWVRGGLPVLPVLLMLLFSRQWMGTTRGRHLTTQHAHLSRLSTLVVCPCLSPSSYPHSV